MPRVTVRPACLVASGLRDLMLGWLLGSCISNNFCLPTLDSHTQAGEPRLFPSLSRCLLQSPWAPRISMKKIAYVHMNNAEKDTSTQQLAISWLRKNGWLCFLFLCIFTFLKLKYILSDQRGIKMIPELAHTFEGQGGKIPLE